MSKGRTWERSIRKAGRRRRCDVVLVPRLEVEDTVSAGKPSTAVSLEPVSDKAEVFGLPEVSDVKRSGQPLAVKYAKGSYATSFSPSASVQAGRDADGEVTRFSRANASAASAVNGTRCVTLSSDMHDCEGEQFDDEDDATESAGDSSPNIHISGERGEPGGVVTKRDEAALVSLKVSEPVANRVMFSIEFVTRREGLAYQRMKCCRLYVPSCS